MAAYVIATSRTAKKFVDNKVYHDETGLQEAKHRLKVLRDERPDSADRFRIYPLSANLGNAIE